MTRIKEWWDAEFVVARPNYPRPLNYQINGTSLDDVMDRLLKRAPDGTLMAVTALRHRTDKRFDVLEAAEAVRAMMEKRGTKGVSLMVPAPEVKEEVPVAAPVPAE